MSVTSSQKITTAVAAQQRGHSLDRIFYKDEDIYQAELDRFFLKHWIFAGHTSQIPEIGNYLNLNFDSESIIVVRSDDNEIKAHLNVCRHRGSRLCIEDSGTTTRFTCVGAPIIGYSVVQAASAVQAAGETPCMYHSFSYYILRYSMCIVFSA